MLKTIWQWVKEKVWWVLGVGMIATAATVVTLPPNASQRAVDALVNPEKARQVQCFKDDKVYCDMKVITTGGIEVTSWPFSGGVKPDGSRINKGYNIVTKHEKDGILYIKRIYRTDDGYGFETNTEHPIPPLFLPAVATSSEEI